MKHNKLNKQESRPSHINFGMMTTFVQEFWEADGCCFFFQIGGLHHFSLHILDADNVEAFPILG